MKEGEKGPKASVEGIGMLVTSTDWQMRVDIRERIEIPPEIAVTNKRPDITFWSAVTVGTFGAMRSQNSRPVQEQKLYQELVRFYQQNEWKP